MSPVSILLLSMSMSADAFAVAVGRGATLSRSHVSEALRTGAVFGTVEAITPFVGWLAGMAANDWVADFDHWLAFALLSAVGLHMIHGAFRGPERGRTAAVEKAPFHLLLATALGTSLDAMAVGLSLAFIGIGLGGIIVISLAIGVATFAMSTVGTMLGRLIGNRLGKVAEVAAGVALCAIGATILVNHLTA